MIWIQAKLKEVASLDGHVLLKKLRDALECLKGRLAGQNKEDVEKAISMVSFRFYAVMTLEICNMLTVCWLVSFLGRGFGSKINPKGRRTDSREIRSEKASEFSQAGSLIYLSLLVFLSPWARMHIPFCFILFRIWTRSEDIASVLQASEDAKKLVNQEKSFACAEIESARAVVQRIGEALEEQERNQSSGKQQVTLLASTFLYYFIDSITGLFELFRFIFSVL